MPGSGVIVVVGGGQAGGWAARTLRQEGFAGRVVVLSDEDHPPYERPPLSKQVLLGEAPPESTYLFPPKAYADWGIDLRLGVRATALDPRARHLLLADGASLPYDRLLLATGASPRRLLHVSGANVLYLRSIADAAAIRPRLRPDARVLIIGGGWIGLEVAAAARKNGASVVLVEAAARLCSRAAPEDLSDLLLDLHRANGVDVRLQTQVVAVEGNGQVERVRLSNGEILAVSCVIVGIGVAPATQLAENAGLSVENGIAIDSRMQTSAADVFAAGDAASYPAPGGPRKRLESWDNAQKQGIAAGKAMLGKDIKLDRYPWFWSDQFNTNVQLIGDFAHYEEKVQLPERAPGSRITLYLRNGAVEGVVGINVGREMRLIKRSLESGQPVHEQALSASVRT